jgi:hypothetical protein
VTVEPVRVAFHYRSCVIALISRPKRIVVRQLSGFD